MHIAIHRRRRTEAGIFELANVYSPANAGNPGSDLSTCGLDQVMKAKRPEFVCDLLGVAPVIGCVVVEGQILEQSLLDLGIELARIGVCERQRLVPDRIEVRRHGVHELEL